ncbi:hypothetical protein [Nocardiopsis sp. JB363]|uniref:hypothetical protein n=1 Tax=Nocardiopsis sp. JB363 TaxID=1434837 RepID=UPI00097B26DC|nr:hypothetical protein [Nocardiopsis sp. JB363]SIO87027.1 hypothetical protein BQ8420_14740 [Nocardiopsis sp. JB363]
MAVIGPCEYDADGKLLRPSASAIGRAYVSMDTSIGAEDSDALTLDCGCTHFAVLNFYAKSPEVAVRRSKNGLARTFSRLEFETGFRKVSVERSTGRIPVSRDYVVTYKLIYAIETDRSFQTVSPKVGYSRDDASLSGFNLADFAPY